MLHRQCFSVIDSVLQLRAFIASDEAASAKQIMIDTYLALLGSTALLGVLFSGLELVLPAEPGQPWRRLAFNMAYTPLGLAAVMLIGSAFTPLTVKMHTLTSGGLLPEFHLTSVRALDLLVFAFVYAFVWDLAQYAMHRAQHAIPALWETHRFHHDETALNAVAQARVHPTSYVIACLFHLPVIALFGVRSPHFIVVFLMFRVWGFVNHANLRISLGRLTPLMSAPQWHRIHHSARPEHRDRNFATFFPVIDLLFGTYYAPKPGEYPPTGIGSRQVPILRAATVGPFLAWYGMVGNALGSRRSVG